jgi:hypothetical protein
MEYRDILTGEMKAVDPEKQAEKVSLNELRDEISELKAMIAQLLEAKGV